MQQRFSSVISIMQSGKFIQYFKPDGIELPAALIDRDKLARIQIMNI